MDGFHNNPMAMAAALRAVADDLARLGDVELSRISLSVGFQVSRSGAPEEQRIATVEALARVLLPNEPLERAGTLFGDCDGSNHGLFSLSVYTAVESERERALREENEALRAQLGAQAPPVEDVGR